MPRRTRRNGVPLCSKRYLFPGGGKRSAAELRRSSGAKSNNGTTFRIYLCRKGIDVARMRRTEETALVCCLFSLLWLWSRWWSTFLGFYPQSGEDDLGPPQQDAAHEEAPPEGPVVDPTPKVLVFHSHASENYHLMKATPLDKFPAMWWRWAKPSR